MNFLVLSSSRGTTFQATLDRIADGSLTARCLGLITDAPDRGCIQKAKASNIPSTVIQKRDNESRDDYDKRLNQTIELMMRQSSRKPPNHQTSKPVNRDDCVVACMGWMWILTPWFIRKWRNRILNVHPALLPKHGGKGMYGHHVHDAVLSAKEKESGVTIHWMDEGVDTGKILLQKTCPVLPDDTAATLQARVQELEREWYPEVLQMIERGEVKL